MEKQTGSLDISANPSRVLNRHALFTVHNTALARSLHDLSYAASVLLFILHSCALLHISPHTSNPTSCLVEQKPQQDHAAENYKTSKDENQPPTTDHHDGRNHDASSRNKTQKAVSFSYFPLCVSPRHSPIIPHPSPHSSIFSLSRWHHRLLICPQSSTRARSERKYTDGSRRNPNKVVLSACICVGSGKHKTPAGEIKSSDKTVETDNFD